MVGRDPDVPALAESCGGERILHAANLGVDVPEHVDRGRIADALRVRRRVQRTKPEDGDRRGHFRQADLQERGDCEPVARWRRPVAGRRVAEHLHLVAERLRDREVGMEHSAACDGRIVQLRQSTRPRTDDEHPVAGRLQHLAERGRREEASLSVGNPRQGLAIRRVQEPERIDAREIHAVAHQPVRLRVRAGCNRRSVDARHRGVHRVMPGEHDTAPAERGQPASRRA